MSGPVESARLREGRPLAQVLAAIDLTQLGRRVADRGRLLAEELDDDLTLFHVVEPVAEAFIPDPVARLVRETRERAAEQVGEWCRGRTDRPVKVETVKGSPAWEIVRAGKHARVVMVGASAVDLARVGPVARQVAESSWTPVLVVRRQPRVPYRRVVVAVDLSETSAAGVDLALELAPGAEVAAFFALPVRFDTLLAQAGMFPEEIDASRAGRMAAARRAMGEFVARWKGRVSGTVVDGPPIEAVQEVARRRGADLVATASRGAGATRMTLLGTVACGLLDRVPCDVAIARVPGEFRRP